METIKSTHSIKGAFIRAVASALMIILLCSAATIYGCFRVQKAILPDSREIWLHSQTTLPDGTVTATKQRFMLDEPAQLSNLVLDDGPAVEGETEYMIERIESSFSALSPRRQTLYHGMSALMVLLPLLYCIMGIGLCAWWFYRTKLAPPIRVLADGAEHIRTQNLDFEVTYKSPDELGQLCLAFENMRRALWENNRQMWNMLEERRTLQASVAHDLRNPIAIIKGYVEYMQENIPNGALSGEALQHTLSNLEVTAKRMERYTDYIRDLHAIEETEVSYEEVLLPEFLREAGDTFTVFAKQHGCELICKHIIPECGAQLDGELFYRILENIISNAVRYAPNIIGLEFALHDRILCATITDDGPGFSEQMLEKKAALFYSEDTTGQHMGLGLATSRVLCQKHGGSMVLSNISPHGACIKVSIAIKL